MEERPVIGGSAISVVSALFGGAVVLICGGIGAALYPLLFPEAPKRAESEIFRPPLDASFDPRLAVDAPAPIAHLTAPGLREMLAAKADDPLAAEFGRRFLADPGLKKIWDDYQQDGDFSGMFHKLQASNEFQPLLVWMKDDAKLRASLDTVVNDRRVSALIEYANTHEHDPVAQPAPLQAARRPAARPSLELDTDLVGADLKHKSRIASPILIAAGVVFALLAWRLRPAQLSPQTAAAHPVPAEPKPAAALSFADKYEIERVLARSDTAQLIEARDKRLGRLVLVHRMKGGDAARRKQLAAAPRAAAALAHPALLEFYEILEDGEDVVLVYERCHGKTAAELAAAPLGAARAAQILEPACLALEAAHAKGVFHRWLAPERILVTVQGFTKVVGLGMG
ncbi:MAG: hypothetical protein HY925_07835, partial [Elusimicrobia bacterium]|nr:hypothetical protein [Elusimicrobiota bacterium]